MEGWAAHREFLSEAAFLWPAWERALWSGASTLVHFTDGVDERFLACEEGLSSAAPALLASWFEEALGSDEGDAVMALALAMLASGSTPLEDRVIAALTSHPQHTAPLARAFELCWRDPTPRLLAEVRKGHAAPVTATLLRVLGWRRHPFGAELRAFLGRGDDRVRAAALRCTPSAAFPTATWVEAGLSDDVGGVRDAARESALWLAPAQAVAEARQAIDRRRGSLELPMSVLAVGGKVGDVDRLRDALREPRLRRQAVWALGQSGWPRAADLCLELLDDPDVADLAAEGFEAVSGIRVRGTPMLPPQDDEDDDDDAAAAAPAPAPTPPTRWTAPLPATDAAYDRDAAASRWAARRGSASADGQRLLRGAPLTGAALVEALHREPLRRRHVRALELGLHTAGGTHIETVTWGWHQIASLDGLSSAPASSASANLDKRAR